MNRNNSIGLVLSKKGAPRLPGKGIDFCEDLPVWAGSSAFELCGSTMFIKFLLAVEFEGFVSVTRADAVGLAGKGFGGTSLLNGYRCVIGSADCLGLRVGGKGNCGPSLAFLEVAVSLTFIGAVVNDVCASFRGVQKLDLIGLYFNYSNRSPSNQNLFAKQLFQAIFIQTKQMKTLAVGSR